MEAKTIHRLLEYNPMDGYKRNDENPLEGDALIVDECSMIDILLFYNLMKAIPSNMRLILVGDIDQWIIDALKGIGMETAKDVLNAPREMLVSRADLEEETVDEVLRILAEEFEEE